MPFDRGRVDDDRKAAVLDDEVERISPGAVMMP
jgi:hypothetical protein